jgi:hypothetical protein
LIELIVDIALCPLGLIPPKNLKIVSVISIN